MSHSHASAPVFAVILAAGQSTRMRSALPKPMHRIAGQPLLQYVVSTARAVAGERIVVVTGPGMAAMAELVAPLPVAVQQDRLGTAHAVLAARQALESIPGWPDGPVLIVFGDTPFVRPDTLSRLAERLAAPDRPAAVVLAMQPRDPGPYGRILRDPDGGVSKIVEARDADAHTQQIRLCNSGVMAIAGRHLFELLSRIGNHNAKKEYYLTDIVAVARERGLMVALAEAEEGEVLGINTQAELAHAEALMQERLRQDAMRQGAILQDPSSVWFSYDTRVAEDVRIEPNVYFGPGVHLARGVTIHAFSYLEGVRIADGAEIGPFARLRPGSVIESKAKVGNFVEIKNSRLGSGAKANHLSYIGDTEVGPGANIGAGTITCNYDGIMKHRTEIGAGVFVGSNSALVAPVKLGDNAIIGAGSVITADVPEDAVALARAEQTVRKGAAPLFRAHRQARKDNPARKDELGKKES